MCLALEVNITLSNTNDGWNRKLIWRKVPGQASSYLITDEEVTEGRLDCELGT